MTGEKKSLRQWLYMIMAGSMVFALLFTVSCSDDGEEDPGPELYDLSGKYTFKEAILIDGKEAIADSLGIPALFIPNDITDQLAGGLLAEAPCIDPENGAVELKSDFKLFFTCLGETNEEQAGTWSINNDTTQLDLNLSVSSGDLQIPITELEIDEINDVISGSIVNFPITKNLLAGFLASLSEEQRNAILVGLSDSIAILVDVDIKFEKVE